MPRTSLVQVENVRRGLAAASGARVDLRAPGAVTSLSEAIGVRCVVNSAGTRTGLVASDATIPFASPMPRLLSCTITVNTIDETSQVALTLSVWSHLGKIRYQAWDVEANDQARFTVYRPASAGTSYAPALAMLELIPGTEYSLQYWLDCIPNITGYTEGWKETGISWIAPESGTAVYYFSQP
jgi:hypothetical protein